MMSVIVCDIDNKICMMHHCSDCPGKEAQLELLRKLFEEINNDFIQFQQMGINRLSSYCYNDVFVCR